MEERKKEKRKKNKRIVKEEAKLVFSAHKRQFFRKPQFPHPIGRGIFPLLRDITNSI